MSARSAAKYAEIELFVCAWQVWLWRIRGVDDMAY